VGGGSKVQPSSDGPFSIHFFLILVVPVLALTVLIFSLPEHEIHKYLLEKR
jgi:hypothetical protein